MLRDIVGESDDFVEKAESFCRNESALIMYDGISERSRPTAQVVYVLFYKKISAHCKA